MNLPINLSKINPEIPFKKHSATIHVQGDLSAVDHKLLNILYKCAYEKDLCKSDFYFLKGSSIADFLGWKGKVKSEIKSSLRTLRTSGIEWNIFAQDKANEDDWTAAGGTGFIAGWLYDEGSDIVRFSLSPEIKRLLSTPNIYAYIDLRVQKKLRGKYELIYYEYFMEEMYRKNSFDIITRWYSINDIRRMLNISEDLYKEFKIFSRDCIKSPINTLNESNIGISVEIDAFERVNRKIVAVKFHVKSTDKNPESVQQRMEFDDEDLITNSNYNVFNELLSLVTDEKLANTIIKDAKEKYSSYNIDDYIRANIEYAKRAEQRGQIKTTLIAFLRSSIQSDYVNYSGKLEEHRNNLFKEIERRKREDEEIKIKSEKDTKFKELLDEYDSLSDEIKAKVYEFCVKENKFFETLSSDMKKQHATIIYDSNRNLFNNEGKE
ncbi:MAG: replication initiation protein [Chitinivibrionales bacterium]|nr:replication initiation protein [Chitinivibrionales bacterium]